MYKYKIIYYHNRQRRYTINIADFQFNPPEICIPPSSLVRWYVHPSYNAQEDEFLISGTFLRILYIFNNFV